MSPNLLDDPAKAVRTTHVSHGRLLSSTFCPMARRYPESWPDRVWQVLATGLALGSWCGPVACSSDLGGADEGSSGSGGSGLDSGNPSGGVVLPASGGASSGGASVSGGPSADGGDAAGGASSTGSVPGTGTTGGSESSGGTGSGGVAASSGGNAPLGGGGTNSGGTSGASGGSGPTGGTPAGGTSPTGGANATGGSLGGSGGAGTGGSVILPATLREAAAQSGTLVGAAVDASALRSDTSYAQVLAREFDYVTPENAMKWEVLAPSSSSYSWGDADQIVGFAEDHGQAIKGHPLVWHRQVPSWVNDSMGAAQLSEVLKSHIEAVLGRYRGRVRAWDVVNEAIDTGTSSGFTDSVFYRVLGPDYIADAFRWARAADPDVLLYYNEVGIERMGPKSDKAYELMQQLVADQVPIDGIGFQSHVSMHRYPSATDLRANIRRFAALGLTVNISEMDVRTMLVPGNQTSRWEAQRIPFQDVVAVCISEPACDAVSLWGFTDKYSWIEAESGMADDPLIFDRQYAPKPAYQGALEGLLGIGPALGENLVANGDFDPGAGSWTTTGGQLSLGAAAEREGNAGCVSGRTNEGDGLAQELLTQLRAGGQFAFSSWIRTSGASSATVEFILTIREGNGTSQELSFASAAADNETWTRVTGDFGLGYEAEPQAVDLKVVGPPAGVELCAADLEVRRKSVP